jgi:hypothetical protein
MGSLAWDDTRIAIASTMLAQMADEQGEAEACQSPQPWEAD